MSNEDIFNALCEGAVSEFTRDKMFRLRYIPMKYYLPYYRSPEDGNGDKEKARKILDDLYGEMAEYGYIALDKKGEPCVLSGGEPVLPHPPKKTNAEVAQMLNDICNELREKFPDSKEE